MESSQSVQLNDNKQGMKHIFSLKNERIATNHIHSFGITNLPSFVDLRPKCPPIFDQGTLGSCTANALVAAYNYDDRSFVGSRLFLYYNERVLDKDTQDDSGSTVSEGIIALKKFGVCREQSWHYDISKFKIKPPATCYTEAKTHEVITAVPIAQNGYSMKQCLASGFPIVLGIQVYESFESEEVAKTGIVPLPKDGEQLMGSHCIVCVGYQDSKKVWIMRNSWGNWGMNGYFEIPYAYLTDDSLASDFWCIQKVHHSS